MPNQYSDSPLTLALDTGSPVTSVAIGHDGEVLAIATAAGRRSASGLLQSIDTLLTQEGLAVEQLGRLIAARGPGSFTGLRIGLATTLGLHQALGLEATAVGTLKALAHAVSPTAGDRVIVAVVDALRGQWFAQPWSAGTPPSPLAEAAIHEPEKLLAWGPCVVTGFTLEALPPVVAAHPEARLAPAPALAPALLDLAAVGGLEWDPGRLVEPLYLRPPAAAQKSRP